MGDRLSRDLSELLPRYDVLVVRSGYGGAITAARLAGPDVAVCLLERGRELRPGEYPDTIGQAAQAIQATGDDVHTGKRDALFDFHVHPDISTLVGSGLGGTSLINASVALTADPRVFDLDPWPAALRDDAGLVEDLDRARQMLGTTPYPVGMRVSFEAGGGPR